jgi:glucose-1-phosphate adenylyltransferase
MRGVVTVILAGGRGTRLEPLTRDRAKPAVPFGGLYRIIDFTLSNCINSGLRRVLVLTQFKSRSLDRHIRHGWGFLSSELGELVEVLPPAAADRRDVVQGHRRRHLPEHLLAGAGARRARADPGRGPHLQDGLRAHDPCPHRPRGGRDHRVHPVPLDEVRHFGIMQTAADDRVVNFLEKPKTAPPMPGDPHHALGSMGIYVFKTRLLFELLCQDAARPTSDHDFGKNIIPQMIEAGQKVQAHRFLDTNRKAVPYWRDVGTLDAYYQANMDLINVDPLLNMYDAAWPIRTLQPQLPPPKFVFTGEGAPGHARRGEALDSIVCAGSIVSGGHVRRSILSPRVRVNSYAVVEDSILLDGVDVGRYCRVRKAIIDKDVKLPPYTVIGYDPEFDRRRGFTVTDTGVVVVPKNEPPETFQAPNPLPN